MKKADIFTLEQSLRAVAHHRGAKFAYAIAKNLRIIQAELKDLQEAGKPDEAFIAYEQRRIDLAASFAIKDDQDQPVIADGRFSIPPETLPEFESQLAKLREECHDILTARQTQEDEYRRLLDEKADIDLFRIPVDVFPEDITGSQLESIFAIIEE